MKPLKFLADILLFNGIFVTLCALALCMATEKQLSGVFLPLFSPLHRVIAGSSLVVYNLHHVVRMVRAANNPALHFTLTNKITRPAFSLTGFLLISSGIFYFPVPAIVVCALLGIISLSYSIPVLPWIGKKRIRDYGWFKILSLAGVWAFTTTLLPAVYHKTVVVQAVFLILPRFIFMFSLCLLFDIRDVRTDVSAHIATLPARIGLHRSYQLVYAALFLWVAFGLFNYLYFDFKPSVIAAPITAVIAVPVIWYLKKTKSTRAYLFLGDGLMLLYGMLVILL